MNWIFIVAVAVVIAVSVWQLRSGGGKGPAVRWVPPSMRGSVNAAYRRRGWPEPYDESGNKIPRSQRG